MFFFKYLPTIIYLFDYFIFFYLIYRFIANNIIPYLEKEQNQEIIKLESINENINNFNDSIKKEYLISNSKNDLLNEYSNYLNLLKIFLEKEKERIQLEKEFIMKDIEDDNLSKNNYLNKIKLLDDIKNEFCNELKINSQENIDEKIFFISINNYFITKKMTKI